MSIFSEQYLQEAARDQKVKNIKIEIDVQNESERDDNDIKIFKSNFKYIEKAIFEKYGENENIPVDKLRKYLNLMSVRYMGKRFGFEVNYEDKTGTVIHKSHILTAEVRNVDGDMVVRRVHVDG